MQGYDASQGYDEYGQGSRQSWDHGGQGHYQDGGQFHKGGGTYNKKRMVPSDPSPHVIFLGLDPDFTESDVSS